MTNEPKTTELIERLDPAQLGERIKHAIEENGYDVASAARALGVGMRQLSRVILSSKELSPKLAVQLYKIGLDGMSLYLGQQAYRYWCASQNYVDADPRFAVEESEND